MKRLFLGLSATLIGLVGIAQSSFLSGGGDSSSDAASVSHSLGQVFDEFYISSSGSIQEGLQQPFFMNCDLMEEFDLGPDTLSLCNGESTTLDAGAGYDAYAWSTGETSQTITATATGDYQVLVTDENGCTAVDSIYAYHAVPSDLEVITIGFGGNSPRVNARWDNPFGTFDCEVRGGRISPTSYAQGNPQFANINNTLIITQTSDTTILFNVVVFNNPNVPFIVGQRYGFEVRCLCEEGGVTYSEWSGVSSQSTFVVPEPPAGLEAGSFTDEAKSIDVLELALFPNPSSGEELNLSIMAGELESGFIQVLDVQGKLVYDSGFSLDDKSRTLLLRFNERLPRGVYILQVWNESQVVNERFVVE
jgi:hypothetical protein